ncbi:MAG: protein tyrosine phosphatase family protein [Anaerolineaceae bacterium]|nr:protein tyrosine phosphatase family protein [Anaerolineaceae bacterium]
MINHSITDITNYLEIYPWLGTAGMPTDDQIECIANTGYQVVINLALEESPGAIADERERVTRLGMNYMHIPVVWESPQSSDLEQFFTIMQQLADYKVFVHCVLNMRVSVFVYLYRVIHLKEDPAVAYQELLEIWQPDETWQTLMDIALKNYG